MYESIHDIQTKGEPTHKKTVSAWRLKTLKGTLKLAEFYFLINLISLGLCELN